MKSVLRERLRARRPTIMSKSEYIADWNVQNNVWAPIDTERFVCDACQGLAVSKHRSCKACKSTGYVEREHVAKAFQAYHSMGEFLVTQCAADEKRFERFLQASTDADLELFATLIGVKPSAVRPPPKPWAKKSGTKKAADKKARPIAGAKPKSP